jgi:hypothetical protein
MATAITDEAGMVAPPMAIDPDMGADMVELPEAATTVVMRVAGITATLPEASMAVAASTVAVEAPTAVAEAMAAVATGN